MPLSRSFSRCWTRKRKLRGMKGAWVEKGDGDNGGSGARIGEGGDAENASLAAGERVQEDKIPGPGGAVLSEGTPTTLGGRVENEDNITPPLRTCFGNVEELSTVMAEVFSSEMLIVPVCNGLVRAFGDFAIVVVENLVVRRVT